MNKKELEKNVEWIKNSDNTNKYVKRSLIIASLRALEEEPPNINEAKRRLRQIIPGKYSRFIDYPDFIVELEKE